MPQMVIPDYAPQVVWLVITFVALYFAMAKFALPKIAHVLEERRKRIDANLERAGALKAEAEAAGRAYEETLAKARDAAHEALRQATQELSQEATKRTAAFDQSLGERTKAAETRIQEAREKAYGEIREIAIEVAEAATAKLIGGTVPKERIVQAIDSTREKKT
ncbi:MAG: F0F1 ATP synthase subunit B' [Alphaproteobacteria bacterium]|nr:F0F1 ATP synthase subunit B' [Alphaproteobacteria bacterium]